MFFDCLFVCVCVWAETFPTGLPSTSRLVQSNPLKWKALGPNYEYRYPLRRSIHLSTFYTLHSDKMISV